MRFIPARKNQEKIDADNSVTPQRKFPNTHTPFFLLFLHLDFFPLKMRKKTQNSLVVQKVHQEREREKYRDSFIVMSLINL